MSLASLRDWCIDAAIFDVDGTLLDSMPAWDGLASRYLRSLGVEPRPDLEARVASMDIGESATYLANSYGLGLSPDEVRHGFMGLIARIYEQDAPAKPGAVELVRALADAGLPLAVATIGEAALASAALERLGIHDCFQELLACSELGCSKHEPTVFLAAAARLGAAPARPAVFEDTLVPVATASAAGFPVVAVKDAASDADEKRIRAASSLYVADLRDALPWCMGRPQGEED